jgi:cytoskeletal protein CcmA (bactofilin family)
MLLRVHKKQISFVIALALVGAFPINSPSYANNQIDLGGSSSFAVLAKTYVTTGTNSTINGDIGSGDATTTGDNSTHKGSIYAGVAITTGASNDIDGNLHAVAAITLGAGNKIAGTVEAGQSAIKDSYSQAMTAMGQAISEAMEIPAETVATALAGRTLVGGAYTAAAGGFLTLAGNLTLDADGDSNSVFIIKSPTYISTAAGSSVTLINGAKASNVFWVIEGYMSMGADARISGNILANGSVTVGAGASVLGRVFSKTSYVLFGLSGPGSSFGLIGIGTGPTPAPSPSPEATSEPSPEATSEPSPEATSEPSPEATSEPSPEATSEPSPAPTSTTQPAVPVPSQSPTQSPIPTQPPAPTQVPTPVPTPVASSAPPTAEPSPKPKTEVTVSPIPEPDQKPIVVSERESFSPLALESPAQEPSTPYVVDLDIPQHDHESMITVNVDGSGNPNITINVNIEVPSHPVQEEVPLCAAKAEDLDPKAKTTLRSIMDFLGFATSQVTRSIRNFLVAPIVNIQLTV